jgi:hypothetical protein
MSDLAASNPRLKQQESNRYLFSFLFLWTLINAVQAYTLEIHADEAYYWLYSKFMDWGYYDHPPMVAVFIRIGYSLFHNPFGVRLLTVTSSTVSLYVLWLILKQYAVDVKWFILVVSGIFMFHIYGFTTTPDAPLFLFTILFYYVYKKYITDDSWKWALWLILIITGLLYSKYHCVLLIGFTVLSNFGLLKRKTFWLIVLSSALLYLPHIFWQVQHEFPSIKFHLFEQASERYDFSQTYTYIPGQLLMAGPLIGWFLFYAAFKTRVNDAFIRCLQFNFIGTFIFFFINSYKGEVQPHWTLIAFVPLITLSLIYISQKGKQPKWLYTLAIINISMIMVVRFALISGAPFIRQIGQLKSLFGFQDWSYRIKQYAGNNYVVMNEGFQNPAKYDFYNNTIKGFAYDSKFYRRTQFDLWPLEDSLQHKRVYFLIKDTLTILNTPADTIKTPVGKWYGIWIDDFRSYQQVIMSPPVTELALHPGEKYTFDLTINNPYPFAIDFGHEGYLQEVVMSADLFRDNVVQYHQDASPDFYRLHLKSGDTAHYRFNFIGPMQKGKYNMAFCLRTSPLPGSKNSRIISLTVR